MTWNPSLAYRESSGQNASPVRLVILLYEQLVKDLQRAAAALDQDLVEERTKEIDHALVVVGHLQGTLDMERGGEVARNLDRFYDLLRTSLMDTQVRLSREILNHQIRNLLVLREAWVEVERSTAQEEAPSLAVPATCATPDPSHAPRTDWKA